MSQYIYLCFEVVVSLNTYAPALLTERLLAPVYVYNGLLFRIPPNTNK